jgi:hypothetical protein
MPYAVKYQYSFNTIQGDECIVYLFFKDYSGPITYLNPGARPFILREYNTDTDLFKPIRGFQAELEILADNVALDDFLSGEDDGVQVQLWFNGYQFWVGWLMQDDFQEDWIDVNHLITLRATDGLGQLAEDPRIVIDGLAPIDEFLGDSIAATPIPSIVGATYINTLFYDGMLDRGDGNYHPLNQAYIDGKTFEGDNNQVMVEKINKAWGQCLYQYGARWWFARQEEFFHSGNVKGVVRGLLGNTNVDKSFDVNVGVGEDVKPIMPLMLRTIRRPFKATKVTYKIEYPTELFCNQSFLNGSLRPPTLNTYTVDCWTLQKGTLGTPVAGTATWYRKEEKDLDGNITDNYVSIEKASVTHWIRSQAIVLNAQDSLKFSFDFKIQGGPTGSQNIIVAIVQFEPYAGSSKYTLNTDGEWIQTNSSYASNVNGINMSWSSAEDTKQWKNIEIKTKGVPADGRLYFIFYQTFLLNVFGSYTAVSFKSLEVEIRESTMLPGVVGDFDRYTIADTVRNNYEEQIHLDDANNRSHKGALFFNNNLTGDNWYRDRYPAERFTFKRHKAIAHMILNRRYRSRLEVSMLGISWVDASVVKPIGLMNRFVFVDDAPTKKFMIANLSEMDFMNATWRATLVEVYDSAVDSEDTANYPPHDFGNIYKRDV